MAGLPPIVIGAEMLEENGDAALSVEDARAYGEKHGIPFLSGRDIMEAAGLSGDDE